MMDKEIIFLLPGETLQYVQWEYLKMPITNGIDISNYQASLTNPEWFTHRIEEGYTDFVVRVGNESRFHIDTAIRQLQEGHAVGGRMSVYYWGKWQYDPYNYMRELMDITHSAQVPIFFSAIDAEDGDRYGSNNIIDWLLHALAALRQRGYNRNCIYTAQWWWEGAMKIYDSPLTSEYLWYAQYDRYPFLDAWEKEQFGNWPEHMVIGKQWRGDPLDLNVFQFPESWLGKISEEDMQRIAELEAQNAELINKLGYVTGDCMNALQDILDRRKMNRAGEREIKAVIDEVRRQA